VNILEETMSKFKNPVVELPVRNDSRQPHTRLLWLALAGCVFLTPLAGCNAEKKTVSPPAKISATAQGPKVFTLTQAQENTLGVTITPARIVELQDQVSCNGQIEAVSPLQVQVFTPAKGRVLQVPVHTGQSVEAGQLMALIKSDDIGQLQTDLLQQTLQNDADIRQAKIQLDFSKTTYNRELELFKEGVSAQADMESARSQYRKDLQSLQAAQLKRRASINASQERLSLYGVSPGNTIHVLQSQKISPYLNVISPRNGMIIERNVSVGEIVDTSKNLFTVADLRKVWISGAVYEKDIEKLHVGQSIRVELEDLPDAPFTGRLNYVSSVLNPQTRTMEVQGEIPNPQLKLKPNMFARMTILVGSQSVLAVPSNAVEKLGDYNFVFVKTSPHQYEERKVTVGSDNGQYVEIKDGLRENEQVVTQGTTGIKGLLMKMASDTGE